MYFSDSIFPFFTHVNVVVDIFMSIKIFSQNLKSGIDEVVLAVDLGNALTHLGKIVGTITTEEILNNIFGQFCIGK